MNKSLQKVHTPYIIEVFEQYVNHFQRYRENKHRHKRKTVARFILENAHEFRETVATVRFDTLPYHLNRSNVTLPTASNVLLKQRASQGFDVESYFNYDEPFVAFPKKFAYEKMGWSFRGNRLFSYLLHVFFFELFIGVEGRQPRCCDWHVLAIT